MTLNPYQKAWYLSGSFVTTARPWRLEDFWTQNSCQALRRLAPMYRNLVIPQVSLFTGKRGTGKTSAARVLGMIASCENIERSVDHAPCGVCEGCRLVQTSRNEWRDGYCEIDAGQLAGNSNVLDDCLALARRSKVFGSNALPSVIVIDEAGSLTETQLRSLHKSVESPDARFVLIVTPEDSRQLTLSLNDRIGRNRFHFSMPTAAETADGLCRVAAVAGIQLDQDAAEWIARESQNLPRAALGCLDVVRPHGPHITLAKVQALYPQESEVCV